ncbi:MAG TPA: division/cell wall cluster transcriptional repressor MraZ [Candidatus Dojkabacteria bacterium]|nr:division/cell wall cluster transcriptional repressor MraZ [Candidatus Dojkabacteria bacterium]
MLIGEYQNKVGDRKRIALPKKLRDELGGDLILTRGYENSLVIVNKHLWENLSKDIVSGSFINTDIRDTSRFLIGSATEIELDEQGRFVLPQALFDYAQLKDDVVFIGLMNWVEVWSKELWTKRMEYLSKNGSEIAQKLNDMNK